MPGTFFALNTALSGLEAAQTAMDVSSHNIANASTPGYSRQTVDLQTTPPFSDPSMLPAGAGQLGSGVTVASVQRSHDDFIQQNIVYQNQAQQQQQALSDSLSQISQIFNDPSNQGFSNLLSNFFSSWQQLANNPSDAPTRAALVSQANALSNGFSSASSALQALQSDEDGHIAGYVSQINTITQQLAGLNQQITAVLAVGQAPNDLQDKRDNLLTQLSQIANVQYNITSNGTVNVALAGAGTLVQGVTANQLAVIPDATKPQTSDVVFQGTTTPLTLSGGQLGGAIANRDVTIASRISALDSLANNVISAVNTYQTAGYGSNGASGITFFTGNSAATMAVDARIQSDPANIAASAAPNSPGDGSQALKIAQLQENPPPGGTQTLQAQYQDMISHLGVDGQTAQQAVQTGSLVLQNLNSQQSSESSVSLNEEAANLVQYQNAYQAAARVVSIMDETISDMISKLGG